MPEQSEPGMALEEQKLTATIAAFAADTPASAIPAPALNSAKRLVLNTLGVALAAANQRLGRILAEYTSEMGGTPATASIIGADIKVSPPFAALANGALAHSLSLDSGNHVTTHVIPAALAVAEHRSLSGAELLDAVTVGFEVGGKLTASLGRSFGRRGWWHPGIVGPVDAAVTAGRLLKLDRHRMAMAIGIASCNCGGFRRNKGTMSQALHSGNAAHDGVQAALLAEKGFTADAAIIEAPLGFMAAVTLPDERNLTPILAELGRPFALAKWPGVKPFPVSLPAQPLIDAIQMMRQARDFSLDDIESIEADLHFHSLIRCDPQDENEAGFSGAYVLAATLVHRDFGLDQVTGGAVRDPRVRELMQRVNHIPTDKIGVNTVTLRFGSGEVLSVELPVVTRRLHSDDDLRRLFHQCARRTLTAEAAEALEDLVSKLDDLPSIDGVMAIARGRA